MGGGLKLASAHFGVPAGAPCAFFERPTTSAASPRRAKSGQALDSGEGVMCSFAPKIAVRLGLALEARTWAHWEYERTIESTDVQSKRTGIFTEGIRHAGMEPFIHPR